MERHQDQWVGFAKLVARHVSVANRFLCGRLPRQPAVGPSQRSRSIAAEGGFQVS
jgi:hypothetical protein